MPAKPKTPFRPRPKTAKPKTPQPRAPKRRETQTQHIARLARWARKLGERTAEQPTPPIPVEHGERRNRDLTFYAPPRRRKKDDPPTRASLSELRKLFAATPARLAENVCGLQHGRATPIRLRPGVPPVRDAEHQAKHRRRKLAGASRRRNRGR